MKNDQNNLIGKEVKFIFGGEFLYGTILDIDKEKADISLSYDVGTRSKGSLLSVKLSKVISKSIDGKVEKYLKIPEAFRDELILLLNSPKARLQKDYVKNITHFLGSLKSS